MWSMPENGFETILTSTVLEIHWLMMLLWCSYVKDFEDVTGIRIKQSHSICRSVLILSAVDQCIMWNFVQSANWWCITYKVTLLLKPSKKRIMWCLCITACEWDVMCYLRREVSSFALYEVKSISVAWLLCIQLYTETSDLQKV